MYFMKAGVMHIMAVSGLHAIILSMFVLTILFFMKRKFNVLRLVITITILWAFAFVTGLTPSVLRATMMFSFLQAGKLMKRPSNGINSVLASAVCLILIRPSVIFDAGFLLSYSAVIFIICFYQDFYLLIHCKNWIADKIWQSAAITIIAQAGTLPLTIMLFNRFPTYFILANITIVPVSNLLIITGCLIPVFFRIVFLSRFLAMLLNHLTGLTETLTREAASLPYSSIENIGISMPECILLSCTIFLFTYYFLKKRSISLIYPVLFLLLLVVGSAIGNTTSKRTNQLIVYNTPGNVTIGIRTGKTLHLYSDTSTVRSEVLRHSSVLGLKVKSARLNKSYNLIKAAGEKILIANTVTATILQQYDPDFIIITDPNPEFEPHLNLGDKKIILVQANKLPDYLMKETNSAVLLYFIKHSGAYTERIGIVHK
jgi:competence protein ComEC